MKRKLPNLRQSLHIQLIINCAKLFEIKQHARKERHFIQNLLSSRSQKSTGKTNECLIPERCNEPGRMSTDNMQDREENGNYNEQELMCELT